MAASGAALALSVHPGAARAEAAGAPSNGAPVFTRTVLPNGMTVILEENHALPEVVVDVGVRVGSRMEGPKQAGFAHLFEHLMFMGTRRAPARMFDAWMSAAGAESNAFTTVDVTEYFDHGPPTALPLLLWLEADRLRDVGPSVSEDKLDAQRVVVGSEWQETHDDPAASRVELRLPELLYSEGHPYHHPVVGSHDDLAGATAEGARQFFATWYDPANVTLVIAGDFDSAQVMPLVRQDFATIASHGAPPDPGAPAPDERKTAATPRRETLHAPVDVPELYLVWPTPKHFAAGEAELTLLARILGEGKESRLSRALVYEQKLAQSVTVAEHPSDLASQFTVTALPRPGVTLEKLEAAIDAELGRARTIPPTAAELLRAKNEQETAMVDDLEQLLGQAISLATYQMGTGDPGYLAKDLERFHAVTAESIQKAAGEALDPKRGVVLQMLPEEAKKAAAPLGPEGLAAPASRTNGASK